MNTVDPNIKVQQMKGEKVVDSQPDITPPSSNQSSEPTPAPAVSIGKAPAQEVAQPANLPSCHHHRSTALW
jgi:hypothetical protein